MANQRGELFAGLGTLSPDDLRAREQARERIRQREIIALRQAAPLRTGAGDRTADIYDNLGGATPLFNRSWAGGGNKIKTDEQKKQTKETSAQAKRGPVTRGEPEKRR